MFIDFALGYVSQLLHNEIFAFDGFSEVRKLLLKIRILRKHTNQQFL